MRNTLELILGWIYKKSMTSFVWCLFQGFIPIDFFFFFFLIFVPSERNPFSSFSDLSLIPSMLIGFAYDVNWEQEDELETLKVQAKGRF